MSIKILISAPLRQFSNGSAVVEGKGSTVEDLLTELVKNGPENAKRLFYEGKLSRSVNIFVNREDIRFLNDLKTPVGTGDEVSIMSAISGG